jgi:hypothetical protein
MLPYPRHPSRIVDTIGVSMVVDVVLVDIIVFVDLSGVESEG